MRNTRVKITGLIVVAVMVCLGLLFAISYRREKENLTSQKESSYRVIAGKYAQELSAWMNTNATIIESMAADITVSGIYETDYDDLHAYLQERYSLLNKQGTIYDIYFTYPDNRMACASDFVPDGSVDYVHDREWFSVPASTGELFYSTPYKDSDTKKPIITISRGVYKDHELKGVIAADIMVDKLVDIIGKAEVDPAGYAFLVDQNMGMIAHPDEAYAYTDVPKGIMDVPDAPYEEVVSKIRSNLGDTVYVTDYDGVERGIVVSKMDNTGWYVGVATSKAELTQGLDSLIREFAVAAAVVLLICGALAVFLAHLLEKHNFPGPEEEQLPEEREPDEKAPQKAERASFWGAIPKRIRMLIPMFVILTLMIGMILYTSRIIYSVAVTNIREVGEDRVSSAAAELTNLLETPKSALWVTADTVKLMLDRGESTQSILAYITTETDHQTQLDESIRGIYGYVSGEYIDGLGWIPPENYDPTLRDWYVDAMKAGGAAAVVSPYTDAQNGDTIISFARALGGEDVIAVDFTMNRIREIVADLQIKGKGYGFIVDKKGLLVAHRDFDKKGTSLAEDEDGLRLLDSILATNEGDFEFTDDGQKHTAFVRQVADEWYVVAVISNDELLAEVRQQVIINVLICSLILAVIAFIYMLARRNEQNYSRRIEELREKEQRRTYEAKTLKLEKEAANQANRAKSVFLASMSHEIRTPMNAVLGMNEMILQKSKDQEILEYSENIRDAGNTLLGIINEILDFSKIEDGKMKIMPVVYDTARMIAGAVNSVSERAAAKGLRLQTKIDPDIPCALRGDDVRLSQVIMNLLTNAVKYTEKGTVSLIMKITEKTDREVALTICVEDTGVGIRKEDMDKLMDSFTRINEEKNRYVEGTGLGMTIVDRLLKMMGSGIEVESEYGKGSRFGFTVRQEIVNGEPVGDYTERLKESRTGNEEIHVNAPTAKVLVTDDNDTNLNVAKKFLQLCGIEPDLARSGEEAVACVKRNTYDIIFLDHMMPGMDGIETLSRMNREELVPENTVMIVLTANAVIGAREMYLSAGFRDYLSKPISMGEMQRVLLSYLPPYKVIVGRDGKPAQSEDTKAEEVTALPEQFSDASIRLMEGSGLLDYEEAKEYLLDPEGLLIYIEDYDKTRKELEEFLESENWRGYNVRVHALKSSSRMIGAVHLSEAAKEAEAASGVPDPEKVKGMQEGLLKEYEEVVTFAGQVLELSKGRE
ncbi:MAG: response regulator [Lachnospiraceae bacterium]|nr:response regulator [Lachnospiraceae bacterium]